MSHLHRFAYAGLAAVYAVTTIVQFVDGAVARACCAMAAGAIYAALVRRRNARRHRKYVRRPTHGPSQPP